MSLAASALLMTMLATQLDQTSLVAPDAAQVFTTQRATNPKAHAFFDWQNLALFSGVAAARSLDYVSTRRFRDKQLKEWLLDDEMVDNKPLFVSIEVLGTAASIGASYLLHRTGYHRLERWTSIIHIGLSTFGGIWNYTLPHR